MNGDGNANGSDDARYHSRAYGGCDNAACHANDASHRFNRGVSTGNTIQLADIGPGACSTCHDTGVNGAPVVYSTSSHVIADGGRHLTGACTDCHAGHATVPPGSTTWRSRTLRQPGRHHPDPEQPVRQPRQPIHLGGTGTTPATTPRSDRGGDLLGLPRPAAASASGGLNDAASITSAGQRQRLRLRRPLHRHHQFAGDHDLELDHRLLALG